MLVPSPSKWTDIIDVSGPQHIEIYQSPQEKNARPKVNKRDMSELPAKSINKRIACNTEEDENFSGKELEISQQSSVERDTDSENV